MASIKETSRFSLDEARARVQRLVRLQKIKYLRTVLVPLTAHLGSIVTIFAAWFMGGGSFKFNSTAWSDWFVMFVLGFVAFSGVRLVVKEYITPRRMVVTRSQLSDLFAVARVEAGLSVCNLSGDLTWLEEDFPALMAVKERKPSLKMSVYYDHSRVPREIEKLGKQLDDIAIRLIPYPRPVSPSIRCMLIDREIRGDSRVYVCSRHGTRAVGGLRNQHLFVWQEYGPESSFVIELITAFVGALESAKAAPIRVGISGVNNVGKTLLATRLQDVLSKTFHVQFFPDEFKVAQRGTTLEDNYIVLFSQFVKEVNGEAEICIFDRTIIDNFCYLRLRSDKHSQVCRVIAPLVAEAAKKFDLIVDVRKRFEERLGDTTYVTAGDRERVRKTLDDFFATYALRKQDVLIDAGAFEQTVDELAKQLAKKVTEIYQSRRPLGK